MNLNITVDCETCGTVVTLGLHSTNLDVFAQNFTLMGWRHHELGELSCPNSECQTSYAHRYTDVCAFDLYYYARYPDAIEPPAVFRSIVPNMTRMMLDRIEGEDKINEVKPDWMDDQCACVLNPITHLFLVDRIRVIEQALDYLRQEWSVENAVRHESLLMKIESQSFFEDGSQNPIITPELIEQLETSRGGYTSLALAYVGVPSKGGKGWKKRMVNSQRRALPYPGVKKRSRIIPGVS